MALAMPWPTIAFHYVENSLLPALCAAVNMGSPCHEVPPDVLSLSTCLPSQQTTLSLVISVTGCCADANTGCCPVALLCCP
jgi:hypothetical protein